MQYNIQLQIDSPEDGELIPFMECYFAKSKRYVSTKTPICPTNIIFGLMSDKQKNIYNLLYTKELYECPICYDNFELSAGVVTNCKHVFCEECLEKASSINSTCPCCRTELLYFDYYTKANIYVMVFTFVYKLFAYFWSVLQLPLKYPIRLSLKYFVKCSTQGRDD